MIPATSRWSKAVESRLFVVHADGRFTHALRRRLIDFLQAGDLVIANDAATLPASLQGVHAPTGSAVEVRLAGWRDRLINGVGRFLAVVFGSGDFHTPTEHRPLPPRLAPGDRILLGPLTAVVTELLGHPRLVTLEFDGPPDAIWAGVARHGRPIQYAHVPSPLALWDVWTAIAGPPVSFEPPSAGFILEWRTLAGMRECGVEFATITHAAGISSTGDDGLDARLPFDEPYEISETTAAAIAAARARRARVVAIGTTVVRALEHAAGPDGLVRPGAGVATQRIGPRTDLRVVDAILTGIHEPGTSHHELLRAFASDDTLARAQRALADHAYRTHEFGDSALIERQRVFEGVTHVPSSPGCERLPSLASSPGLHRFL
jgi:S-adenosylmethionine:tRNA ribosyltransferase-isomerase